MSRSPKGMVIGGLCLGALFIAGAWMIRSRSGDPSAAAPDAKRQVRRTTASSGGADGVQRPPQEAPVPRPADPRPAGPASEPAGTRALPRDFTVLRDRALDAQAPPSERLAAARLLKRDGFLGGMPEVLGAMALMLRSSPDESLRAQICRDLRGADSEEWRRQLMTTAQSDGSSRARLEAVVSLSDLANSDPFVRQFLEQAQERESDPDVKRELRRALARRP